jgi:16S rRNA (guanine527-N7)-methyltransferase
MPPTRPALPLPASTPLPVPSDLGARLAAVGVTVDAPTLARVGDYLARLLAMNEHVNLTAITDPDEAWTRHGFDALTLLPGLTSFRAGSRVIDIGSGGGVPGIVLALARPDLSFTLVESTAKKANFLVAVIEALGLANVTVRAERAEKLLADGLRGTFDVCTARAVARLDALLPWTAPFVRPGGRVLLIKGQQAETELAEARKVLARTRAQLVRVVPTPTGRVVVLAVS